MEKVNGVKTGMRSTRCGRRGDRELVHHEATKTSIQGAYRERGHPPHSVWPANKCGASNRISRKATAGRTSEWKGARRKGINGGSRTARERRGKGHGGYRGSRTAKERRGGGTRADAV